MKPEPRGARRKPTKIECLAYHEAGHFVAAMFSRKRPAVRRLSVLPRDKTLGHVLHFSTPGFRSKTQGEAGPMFVSVRHRSRRYWRGFLTRPRAQTNS
jgi:ATP-dependent Zn protease